VVPCLQQLQLMHDPSPQLVATQPFTLTSLRSVGPTWKHGRPLGAGRAVVHRQRTNRGSAQQEAMVEAHNSNKISASGI